MIHCPDVVPETFYPFHSLATPAVARGRPSGGITILCKSHLEPELCIKDKFYLSVRTADAIICCFYFKPETDVGFILTTILHVVTTVSDGNIPVVVMGDFNCRADGARGDALTENLATFGFKLVNNKQVPTYIDHHGSSVIDLVFINLNSGMRVNSQLVIPTIIKKHQKVVTCWTVSKTNQVHTEQTRTQALSRSIDMGRFTSYLNFHPILPCLEQNDIEQAVSNLGAAFESASRSAKPKYHHKPWFDSECRNKKKETLTLFHQKINCRNFDGNIYNAAKQDYTKLIKKKRDLYEEDKLIKKIEDTERKPWTLFRTSNSKQAAPIAPERLYDHFQNLLNPFGRAPIIPATPNESFTDPHCWYNRPFSEVEVQACAGKLAARKATGPDRIANEHITATLNCMSDVWTKLFNWCLINGCIPSVWSESTVKLLYKGKGEIEDPGNYRGIALLCCPLKLLTALINKRIMANIYQLLPIEQFGFLKGRNTTQPLGQLMTEVSIKLSQHRGKLYAAYVDFKKAFDMLDRNLLCTKMIHQFNIKGRTHNLVRSILKGNRIQIDDGVQLSEFILQNNGVVQGDSLSPTLFILFIADLSARFREIAGIQFLFYADDLVVFTDMPDCLRKALTALEDWCQQNKFEVNSSKTKIMKFRKGGRLCHDDQFQYGGTNISIVTSYEYLGVTLQQTLTFTEHLQKKKVKCLAIIGTLTHLQRVSVETGMRIFQMKIAPIVTYGMTAFASYLTKAHFKIIDQVKAAFVKRLLGVHSSTSSTLALLMLNENSFLYDLDLTMRFTFDQNLVAEYILEKRRKRDELCTGGHLLGPAFTTNCWKQPNQPNRHLITRFSAHGFHHLICTQIGFHELSPNCRCKLCNQQGLDRFHLRNCVNDWQAFIKQNS